MPKRIDADLSPADRIRYQLLLAGLSQRAGARALGIDDRTMRKYCSGHYAVPRVVDLAMQFLVATNKPTKLKPLGPHYTEAIMATNARLAKAAVERG